MILFEKLARLKKYHREILDQQTLEQYCETGQIMHKKNTIDTIISEEYGKFNDSRYQHKTHNYYQWRLIEHQQLQLSHIHYQQNITILLASFNLQPNHTDFISLPYHCGKDCYKAQLNYDDETIILSWVITGPQKNLLLKSYYTE